MKILFTALLLGMTACGSTSSPGSSNDCNPYGTWTEEFTAEPGGVGCLSLSSATLSLSPDGGTVPGCSNHLDLSSCDYTSMCTIPVGNIENDISSTVTIHGSSATGKETLKETNNGQVTINCIYDITATKH